MRFSALFLVSLTLVGTLRVAAAQQTKTPKYHVNVRLVNVFVTVTAANGAPIAGLTQNDFALSEDGIPQKIAYFERDTSMPLSIVLAIDTSGSVFGDLAVEEHAARDFVHALLRPVDRFDLIDFNSDVDEIVPFTNNLHQIDAGLTHLTTGPATAFYNAIWLASKRLAARPGRKVLVLISDGGNTVDGVSYPEALEEAVRGEVMIYSLIDVPIPSDAGRNTGGEHAMISLSQSTGGKYYYVGDRDLAQVFQQVSDDLRTQYLISYYPVARRSESDFRHIQVTMTPSAGPAASRYVLRYRPGYYAPPSPPLDR
jgi:Ca-activated chloride channel family protein